MKNEKQKPSTGLIILLCIGIIKLIFGVAVYCIYAFTDAWASVMGILDLAVVFDAMTAFIGQPLLASIISLSCLLVRKSNGEKAKSDKWLASVCILIWIASAVVWCSAVKMLF